MSDGLGYRPCVGVMLVNSDGKVFVGRRIDNKEGDWWQMPQGGVDDGEDLREAALRELHEETSKFANVLKGLGVKKGDVVTIYMPMIVETAVAMLACARIGAIHSVVFGGFSPEALGARIVNGKSRFVVTADEGVVEPIEESGAAKPKGSSLSQRLLDELAMQRRDILAIHLANDPALALDFMVFTLAGADGHAEGDAGLTILASHVIDALRAAGHEGAQHRRGPVHGGLYRAPGASHLAQHAVAADLYALEVDLAHLGADPAGHHTDGHSRGVPANHKHGQTFLGGRAVGSAGEIACQRVALPWASLSIPKWGLCQRICLCLPCTSRSDRMELKAAGRRIIATPKGSGIHDGFCVGSLGIRHLRWIS